MGRSRIALPVLWVGVEEQPVLAANQFLIQVHEGEVFLVVGHVTPPPFVLEGASLEEVRRQAAAIGSVPVRALGRYALTPRRLAELIELLQRGQGMLDREAEK